MPHQCLACGKAFADGSTDLLKGCTGCGGTRFFFTEKPLAEGQRKDLAQKTEDDLHDMLRDVLKNREKRDFNKEIWGREAWEKWVRLERPTAGAAVEATPVAAPAEAGPPVPKKMVQASLDVREAPPLVVSAPLEPESAPGMLARPNTLTIVEPGNYEIDVQRLMDAAPVIVERDGSYVIHLPSVFAKATKRR